MITDDVRQEKKEDLDNLSQDACHLFRLLTIATVAKQLTTRRTAQNPPNARKAAV